MAYPIKSVPEACVNNELRNGQSCIDCFYSFVDEKNQWHGYDDCWNAACLALDESRLSDGQRKAMNL